jgi:hypothetical protein
MKFYIIFYAWLQNLNIKASIIKKGVFFYDFQGDSLRFSNERYSRGESPVFFLKILEK